MEDLLAEAVEEQSKQGSRWVHVGEGAGVTNWAVVRFIVHKILTGRLTLSLFVLLDHSDSLYFCYLAARKALLVHEVHLVHLVFCERYVACCKFIFVTLI